MSIARITGLNLFPVKGLRGLPLDAMEIEPCGPAGDRRWLVTDPEGVFLTQRTVPDLARIAAVPTGNGVVLSTNEGQCAVTIPGEEAPIGTVSVWHHQVQARQAAGDAQAWLSAVMGRPCLLWFMHDTAARPIDPQGGRPDLTVSFADAYPLLAVNRASLDALNATLGENAVPIERFRANLVIEGPPAWSENGWRSLTVGGLRFHAPTRCTRCVVITRDQQSGEAPHPGEPLKSLGQLNRLPEGIVFGVNLIPEAPGRVSVGDPVEIEEAG
ncbi:MOSC domain-containing protein [Acetobacteraceae bacterium KSS8]|uniref:MOSC domain-containing protein n=1 Tax=Endosaccharibacter trunci TaxID=2812733 RepID=A0ABT1W2I3_9PROT|nr:MOSC domain-containing protein [Acetobacteraceae bacterium KSS8]